MNKLDLIEAIDSARRNKRLSRKALAERCGLNVKTVCSALSKQGNPEWSTLEAILTEVGLEIQLVPFGFGPLIGGYRSRDEQDVVHVLSVVDVALGRRPR